MDRVEISSLLDIYGNLLPEKQRLMLELYCDEDLSLSEVAENIGITRQGVRDAIQKAVSFLTETEQKLHLAENNRLIAEKAQRIIELSQDKAITEAANEIIKLL